MTDSISARLRAAKADECCNDIKCDEAADHIDAQDAKIKALVEAGEAMNPRRIGYGESMCQASFDKAWGNLSKAILFAKETT